MSWLLQQEQEEAQRLFESHPDGLPAERTFEPGEGLAEAEGLPQDEDMEAVPEPTVRKGPTPEQITAIKVCCVVSHVFQEAPAARGLLPGACHSAGPLYVLVEVGGGKAPPQENRRRCGSDAHCQGIGHREGTMPEQFVACSSCCQRAVIVQSYSTLVHTSCLHMQQDLRHAACELGNVTQWLC